MSNGLGPSHACISTGNASLDDALPRESRRAMKVSVPGRFLLVVSWNLLRIRELLVGYAGQVAQKTFQVVGRGAVRPCLLFYRGCENSIKS